MADVARARSALPQSSRCGSAWECRRTFVDQGLWVKRFVGKTRSTLQTQRHQQVLVAEGVKESYLGDRFRKQLHRDRVGFNAPYILGQVVMVEANVSRLSRNASVLQGHAVCGAVVFGFDGNG